MTETVVFEVVFETVVFVELWCTDDLRDLVRAGEAALLAFVGALDFGAGARNSVF